MRNKLHTSYKTFARLRTKRLKRLKIVSRHPFAVPVFTFGLLLLLTGSFVFGVRLSRHNAPPPRDAKIVIISHDHEQQIVPSRERTVGGLLKRLNIQLNEGDVVEPAQNAVINQDDFRINIYRALPVEVVDGDTHHFAFSAATTPRSIAKQANTSVYAEDVVHTDPVENFLQTGAIGEQVVVERATPVNVNLYGTPLAIRTQAKTVGDLLKQKNIKLAKDDQVTPAATTPLTPQTQVFIVRNGTQIESVTEDIVMPVQKINDPTLAYGTTAVRQQGAPGKQVTTYQKTLKNGVEVSRTVIQTVVTQQPVTQINVVGTSISGIKGDMALAGISPDDYNYVDYIVSHESGWNPSAQNASGAYGLCQALPGSKMASAGSDWATNPITQLKWCTGYATGRYGSWAGAYNYWVSHRYW